MLTFPHCFALREGESAPGVYQVKQVHGRAVIEVRGDEPWWEIAEREADAIVTRAPGVRVGVRTADCVPVLIEDPAGRACAAAHAGWRGLYAGVIEAAVAALGGEPAGMRAALGPSIGPCCYEVGPEVAAQFAGFLAPWTPKPHVDLRDAARAALRRAGVAAVDDGAVACTKCDPREFYSYRRDGKDTPSHLHYIAVP